MFVYYVFDCLASVVGFVVLFVAYVLGGLLCLFVFWLLTSVACLLMVLVYCVYVA